LKSYRKQRKYQKSACRVIGDRGNIRKVLANLQGREGISEECLQSYRRQCVRKFLVKER